MEPTIESIQRESIEALKAVLPIGEDVALLDHPNHFNAGDLLIYQERAILDHRDRKIVQLPQTIEIPDLTLMIRDKIGLEQARDQFPGNNVVYCPDRAFGAGERQPVSRADFDWQGEIVVDNANKKISNIYRDYLGRSPMTHLAHDFDEAGEVARALL